MSNYDDWRNEVINSFERPIKCIFCGYKISKLKGSDQDSIVLCRLDGDPNNNEITNLAPMHKGCNSRWNHLAYKSSNWKGDLATESAKKHNRKIYSSIRSMGLGPGNGTVCDPLADRIGRSFAAAPAILLALASMNCTTTVSITGTDRQKFEAELGKNQ